MILSFHVLHFEINLECAVSLHFVTFWCSVTYKNVSSDI